MALQNLRSNTANKRPTASGMVDGQVAINTNATNPGLFFKDAGDDIRKVGPVFIGSSAPNSSPAAGGSSGHSIGEQWLDTSASRYVLKIWDGTAWRDDDSNYLQLTGGALSGALTIDNAANVAALDLKFDGDTNTGFYSPSADTLGFVTGGVEHARIDSSGRVLINETAAATANSFLTVKNGSGDCEVNVMSGPTSSSVINLGDTGDYNIGRIKYDQSTNSLRFDTSNAERLRIDSSGNVGIGTTHADFKLDVGGPIGLFESNNIVWHDGTGARAGQLGFTSGEVFTIKNSNSQTERLRIDSSGNVGIGTSSPTSRLHVDDAVSTITLESDASNDVQVRFQQGSTFVGAVGYDHSESCVYLNRFGNATQGLAVDNSGNVGIGKASPTSVLDIRDTQTGAASEIKLFNLDQGNTATQTSALVMTPDVRANGAKISVVKENADFSSTANRDVAITFAPVSNNTATERLRIDSSGIITTDSGHTTARLNVVNGSTVSTYDKMLLLRSSNLSNAVLGLGSDSFHISSLTNAPIVFHTNSDGGTSGSAVPSNERMRIDSSGNVGIGTSSPGVLVDAAGSNPTLRVRATTINAEVSTLRLTEDNSYVGAYVKYDGSTNLTHIGTHSAADSNTANDNNAITIVRDNRNVGIRTTSPNAVLTTDPESGNFSSTFNNYDGVGLFIRGNGTSGNGNYGPALAFGSCDSDTANQDHKHCAISIVQTGTDPNETGLAFWTHPSNTSTDALVEKLRIDSQGNVGIGTTSPSSFGPTLQVAGTDPALLLQDTATAVDYFGTNITSGFVTNWYDDAAVWRIGTANGITGGAYSEKFRIDSSGKVGVGLTPTSATLEVAGQNVFASSASSLTTAATKAAFRVKGSTNSSDSLWMGVETVNAEPYIQGANGIGSSAKDILLNPFGGDVGIGTTSPTSKFDVEVATNTGINFTSVSTAPIIDFKANSVESAARIRVNEASGGGVMQFATKTTGGTITERMRIDNSGRVGIGTSSPDAKLQLVPTAVDTNIFSIRRQDHATINLFRFFQDSNVSQGTGAAHLNTENRDLILTASPTADTDDGIYLKTSGDVGIGTASPDALCHINKNSGTTLFKASVAGNSTIGLEIAKTGATTQSWRIVDGQTVNGKLEFYDVTDSATRMCIDGSGNIGIGTTSPNFKLDVNGEVAITEGQGLTWHDANGGRSAQIYGGAGDVLVFRNTSSLSERMRIDSSGRLLIGASASTHSDAQARLQVHSAGATNIVIARNDSTISAGNTIGMLQFYGNDGGTYQQCAEIRCDADLDHANNDKPSRLVFGTTADGASSATERMRITSGGLLYVGTTTADGSAHVFETSAPNSHCFVVKNTNGNNSVATLGLKIQYSVNPNDTNNAIQFSTSAGVPFVVRNNGNVQNTNGSFTSFSDARYKENIVDASSQWEDIKNTRIRNWNFKPELGWATHTMLGPVAQELELVSPGLVIDNPVLDEENNPTGEIQKSVNQSVLYMKAVKALQEAMERIEALEAKVAALESE